MAACALDCADADEEKAIIIKSSTAADVAALGTSFGKGGRSFPRPSSNQTSSSIKPTRSSVIKRPVVEWPGGQITVGFDEAAWSKLA